MSDRAPHPLFTALAELPQRGSVPLPGYIRFGLSGLQYNRQLMLRNPSQESVQAAIRDYAEPIPVTEGSFELVSILGSAMFSSQAPEWELAQVLTSTELKQLDNIGNKLKEAVLKHYTSPTKTETTKLYGSLRALHG